MATEESNENEGTLTPENRNPDAAIEPDVDASSQAVLAERGDETAPAKRGAASAGARLAAAKAAKAAKKAAKRAEIDAESAQETQIGPVGVAPRPPEDPTEALRSTAVGQAAVKAAGWAKTNQAIVLGLVAALILGVGAFAAYSTYRRAQNEDAGRALAEAVSIASASIAPEATATPEDEHVYRSANERAEAALEAYRKVLADHADTAAARWARLGVAKALFDLGRADEAREAYEGALRDAGSDGTLRWRALEGIAFTYEAEQAWDRAIEQYQELRTVDDGAYSVPAEYGLARMRLAKGETLEATTAFRELMEHARESAEGEEPRFTYVLARAELRLRELDPGSAPPAPTPGAGAGRGLPEGLEGLPPEVLEQLRQLQAQQQGGSEAPEDDGQ